MYNIRGRYRIGGIFLLVSAILLFAAFALSGGLVNLLLIGAVSALLALGLFREYRWLAHLSFLFALVITVMGVGGSVAPAAALPNLLWMLIALCSAIAAIGLFAALWSRPEPTS